MRNIATKTRFESRAWRIVAVTSLALTLAAFACTTNHYRGNGEPVLGPAYGPLSPSSTPGSSYGTEGTPLMASSYRGIPRVNTDAIALLAAEQGFRGRVLGPVNPSGVQLSVPVQPTGGQFVSPSLIVNPQATVNSSISSPPIPVITGGDVGGGITLATTATGGAITAPLTAAPTVNGAAGVGVTGANGTAIAGTTAAQAVASNASFSPTLMNSAGTPVPTGSAVTFGTIVTRSLPAGAAMTTATSAQRSGTTATIAAQRNAAPRAVATVMAVPIRIESTTSGHIVVTNAHQ